MITPLPLIYAPNEIFKKKALAVTLINDEIRFLIDRMVKTMYLEKAIGLAANMVGILKRIIIVDLQESSSSKPYIFINPEIIYFSSDIQTNVEASVCFPGISAEIARSRAIKVNYKNYEGKDEELEAEGWLAAVIQHETDYLNGKIFLDYLSKLKSELLMKKVIKYLKLNPPHFHTSECRH